MAEDIAEHGVACISWNERVFDRPELVVGSYSGKVAVWCKDGGDGSSGKWRKVGISIKSLTVNCSLCCDRSFDKGM